MFEIQSALLQENALKDSARSLRGGTNNINVLSLGVKKECDMHDFHSDESDSFKCETDIKNFSLDIVPTEVVMGGGTCSELTSDITSAGGDTSSNNLFPSGIKQEYDMDDIHCDENCNIKYEMDTKNFSIDIVPAGDIMDTELSCGFSAHIGDNYPDVKFYIDTAKSSNHIQEISKQDCANDQMQGRSVKCELSHLEFISNDIWIDSVDAKCSDVTKFEHKHCDFDVMRDRLKFKLSKVNCHLCKYSSWNEANLQKHIKEAHLKYKNKVIHNKYITTRTSSSHLTSKQPKSTNELTIKCQMRKAFQKLTSSKNNETIDPETPKITTTEQTVVICDCQKVEDFSLKQSTDENDCIKSKMDIKKNSIDIVIVPTEVVMESELGSKFLSGTRNHSKEKIDIDTNNPINHIQELTDQSQGLFDNYDSNDEKDNVTKFQCHADEVHVTPKKFKCHLCDYSSSKRGTLNRHIDGVHLKLKKFKCTLCEYTTTRKITLEGHINGVHLKFKKFKCELCEYSATNKGSLQRHIDAIHLKLKKFKCDLCGYGSMNKKCLQRHMNRIHN